MSKKRAHLWLFFMKLYSGMLYQKNIYQKTKKKTKGTPFCFDIPAYGHYRATQRRRILREHVLAAFPAAV